jgi:hypothetical protein
MQPQILPRSQLRLVTGSAFVGGAMVIIVFNALFPRVADPWDTFAVLTMMVENQTMRQVSFLAVTVGLLAITAGLIGVERSLSVGSAAVLARIGLYAALVGSALFAVAAGLGMAATGAAIEWASAGLDVTSTEYAVAAALNHADDGVWFLSIITYWGGLGLLGAAMVASQTFPRWLGVWILVVGLAAATLVGVPLAFGVQAPVLFLLFGAMGMLTALWALTTGLWVLRKLG